MEIKKLWGAGHPTNVYLNAKSILEIARQNKHDFDTFSVRRDIGYVYIYVGDELVFKTSRKNLNGPTVYIFGGWVYDLNTTARQWKSWTKRYADYF